MNGDLSITVSQGQTDRHPNKSTTRDDPEQEYTRDQTATRNMTGNPTTTAMTTDRVSHQEVPPPVGAPIMLPNVNAVQYRNVRALQNNSAKLKN